MKEKNIYKIVFNNANDAIFIHDLDGNFLEVNDTACNRLGYSRDELLQMTPKEIDSSKYGQLVDERIKQLKKEGETFLETEHISKEGKIIPTELSSRIINFRGNKAILSIARDISQRKEAELDLKKKNEVLENCLIPIAFTNVKGIITYVNLAFLEKWGYSGKGEVIGKSSEEFWQFEKDVLETLYYLREHGTWKGNLIGKKKDGSLFEIQIYASLALDENGNPESIFGWFVDISKENEQHKHLVETEKRYQLLFETMTQGVVYHGKDGKIISANPAAEKILGRDKKEVYSKTSHSPLWKTIREDGTEFPPDDHPAMVALSTGNPVYDQIMGVFNPNKENYRWININAIPLFHKEADEPYQVYAIFEDITDKKKAEDALKKSEKKLQGILDGLTELVCVIDKNYNILWGNKKLRDSFGEKLKGEKCYEIFYQSKKPCNPCIVQKTLKDQKVHEIEKKAVGKDDKAHTYWCKSSIAAHDSSGKPRAAIEICSDITARKEIEQKLRLSEEKYRDIAELLPELIYEIDTSFNLTYTNPAGYELFGYTKEDLKKGINVLDLIVLEEDKKKIINRINQYLQGKTFDPAKYLMKTKDEKEFYARIHTRPIYKEERIVGFRGVIINIDRIIKTQRRLNFYKDLLAHDIANILNNINLALKLAKPEIQNLPLPEQIKMFPEIISSQVQDGVNLVSNIQRISEIQNDGLKKSNIDAYKILRDVIENPRFTKNNNISVEINSPRKKLPVMAGPFLKDIFENIIINAVKHNRSEKKWVRINISYFEKNGSNYVKFDFFDNGVGIPDKLKNQIFKREHQSDLSSKGMGIGLSLVKQIIKEYNGKISVMDRIDGNPSQGTIFSVLIPAV
jgi:PAS domain S-box-containing protein